MIISTENNKCNMKANERNMKLMKRRKGKKEEKRNKIDDDEERKNYNI